MTETTPHQEAADAAPARQFQPDEGLGKLDDWAIDRSTASPILTYQTCSVIQDDQAFAVLDLVKEKLAAAGESVTAARATSVDEIDRGTAEADEHEYRPDPMAPERCVTCGERRRRHARANPEAAKFERDIRRGTAEAVSPGPADATDAMIEAGLRVDATNEDERAYLHNVWHAMRFAAPPSVSLERLARERNFGWLYHNPDTAERLVGVLNEAWKLKAEVEAAFAQLSADNERLTRERENWERHATTSDAVLARLREAIRVKGGDEHSPTSDAYVAACRAIDKHRDCAETAEGRATALQERLEKVEEAARLSAMYLKTGFIECTRCGEEVQTVYTDAEHTLRAALTGDAQEGGR